MQVEHLGLMDYDDALTIQTDRVTARLEDCIQDTLLICEHPPVITCGRGVSSNEFEHLKAICHVPVIQVSRGGGVTAHEPGQLVIYPILKIQPHQLRRVLTALETAIADSLNTLGLNGRNVIKHLPGQTGVWIADNQGGLKKIASIGLACRRWVTYHGLALNVCNDLRTFAGLNPCGFPSDVMTTVMQQGLGPSSPKSQTHLMSEVTNTLANTLLVELAALNAPAQGVG